MILTSMKPFAYEKQEYIAKCLGDLGKAVFAVGVASYFFNTFPILFRIALGIFCMISLVVSIIIYPNKGGS